MVPLFSFFFFFERERDRWDFLRFYEEIASLLILVVEVRLKQAEVGLVCGLLEDVEEEEQQDVYQRRKMRKRSIGNSSQG